MKKRSLLILATLFASVGIAYAGEQVRWDIVNLPPFCPAPGGVASALANDNSKITMTGSGTFVSSSGRHDGTRAVTGGGTWATVNASGAATGGGTYEVTGLVRWERAPGVLNCPNDPTEGTRSAGLAVFEIEYSDGSEGVLLVSCRLAGSPSSVFEGIAASKDFVTYNRNIEPVAGVNANRTLFHIEEE